MAKTKYILKSTAEFRKNYRTMEKRGLPMQLLDEAIRQLVMGESLPPQNKDHALKGKWKNFRECHIQPDWLLVYQIIKDTLVLTLSRTGTHSDIFGNE